MSASNGAWRVFRIPLLLMLVSGAALIAALLFDGIIDIAWAAVVAAPLAVIVWKIGKSLAARQ